MFSPLESIVLDFQDLSKAKIGMSFCDVTVTLKREEKIGNLFFLKQNTFLYKKTYVWHFYPKNPTGLHSGIHYKRGPTEPLSSRSCFYQSPRTLTELFQHDLINVSYLTACYLYQVMMTLHFLNDVANDDE